MRSTDGLSAKYAAQYNHYTTSYGVLRTEYGVLHYSTYCCNERQSRLESEQANKQAANKDAGKQSSAALLLCCSAALLFVVGFSCVSLCSSLFLVISVVLPNVWTVDDSDHPVCTAR